jgi:hypothetical protein
MNLSVAALVVAIISALISAGALIHNIESFRRQGWELWVKPDFDREDQKAYAVITNVGRQMCFITGVTFFVTDISIFRERGLPPESHLVTSSEIENPVAPSQQIKVECPHEVPVAFRLEVMAAAGGQVFHSEKFTARL